MSAKRRNQTRIATFSSISACVSRYRVQRFLAIAVLMAQLPTVATFSASSTIQQNNIQYRQGMPHDELKIASTLLKELMNPLGIKGNRFVVATDLASSDTRRSKNPIIGWAQIKPLGTAQQRDPSIYDARAGSYSLDQDVDDTMWDSFEQDESIRVPVGFKSLPWTKEYRAMQEAVKDRDTKRQRLRQEIEAELEADPRAQLWELSSVYVEPAYRSRGIGTELVRQVLRQRLVGKDNKQTKKQPTLQTVPGNIYCLTLSKTAPWYKENFGFELVSDKDVPAPMAFEVTAGNVITKLIGSQLCCMRGTDKTLDLCGVLQVS